MAAGSEPSSSPPFCCYEKMAESSSLWRGREFDAIKKWIALEKVHGANFSLTAWQEGGGGGLVKVKMGKRSGYLEEQENFFGIHSQVELQRRLMEGARRVFRALAERTAQLWAVIVYGELFGGDHTHKICSKITKHASPLLSSFSLSSYLLPGFYPHATVPSVNELRAVQKEIAYCPGLNFCAFDVAIVGNAGQKGTVTSEHTLVKLLLSPIPAEYLGYKTAMDILQQSGLLYLKPLCQGSLQEVTSYPLSFPTTIPQQLGLPPLQGNLAEGVVIKPLEEPIYLDTSRGQKRVIMKRKCEKFAERKVVKRPMTAGGYQAVGNQQLLKYEMLAMMTEQRVTNAISKLGWPTGEEWNEVVRVMVEEVREELQQECPELLACCGEEELRDSLQEECALLVEEYRNSH